MQFLRLNAAPMTSRLPLYMTQQRRYLKIKAAELKTTMTTSLECWKAKFLLDNGLVMKTTLYIRCVNRYLCA